MSPDLLRWSARPHGTPDNHEVIEPCLAALTDNAQTELNEVRLSSVEDRTPLLTLVQPEWELTEDGLVASGHVARKGYRADPWESWLLTPLDSQMRRVPWRAEVRTISDGVVISSHEPAQVLETTARRSGSSWERIVDLPINLWPEAMTEWEHLLLITTPTGEKRWIDDYDIHRLHSYEFTIRGTTKHRRVPAEVEVRLTPSGIPQASAALGSRPHPLLAPSNTRLPR